jgi:hypothetical protein
MLVYQVTRGAAVEFGDKFSMLRPLGICRQVLQCLV